ncbi:hypothetical protein F9U44_13155 [Pectobacterium versatile]|uniref:hypothetical protein n=1 Tax=Pectobacterium versatile TaxID=2488639 RepID=UPI001B3A746A|nr:hypothetical protein [Pectobacterium versatile]MBQ4772451.1 hypothetical protein [Pectobacterium versatile]
MSRFEEIQKRLGELNSIPVNMPKLYLLGDTGAGKTTIVRKILDTEELKFPSVQQKRTTVAVTEYVISRDLPYSGTYLFKTESQISDLIEEILKIAIDRAYNCYKKAELSIESVIEDLEETPDERFRLRYILTNEQLSDIASDISHLLPTLNIAVKNLCSELQSKEEELSTVVDIAIEQQIEKTNVIKNKIIDTIKQRVSEVCDGHDLFSSADFFQHSSSSKDEFISKAKLILSSTKNSISPVIEYARLQGNLLASWLPKNTELVLIDGEGIGHDTREASKLSARHLDYFHFSDSICLVEECKKPFASGGKSAIESIIRNGYSEKFNLIFTKLDEVEINEDEEKNRQNQIRAVRKGLTNVRQALKEDATDFDIEKNNLYHLSNMNNSKIDESSEEEINRLLTFVREKFEEEKTQFVQPNYDVEMLSSYLLNSSKNFTEKWNTTLHIKHWQTIKAFNRRMCWEWDEFKDMKPISDFHSELMKELDYFISNPNSWDESATPSMQNKSISKVKQEFSKQLLAFARTLILKNYSRDWQSAMYPTGWGSTTIRKEKIREILRNILPDHRKPEASKMKDDIKELLLEAIILCKK